MRNSCICIGLALAALLLAWAAADTASANSEVIVMENPFGEDWRQEFFGLVTADHVAAEQRTRLDRIVSDCNMSAWVFMADYYNLEAMEEELFPRTIEGGTVVQVRGEKNLGTYGLSNQAAGLLYGAMIRSLMGDQAQALLSMTYQYLGMSLDGSGPSAPAEDTVMGPEEAPAGPPPAPAKDEAMGPREAPGANSQ